MIDAYLSLGSNLGEKEENLIQAITSLKSSSHIEVSKISSMYLTEPVGFTHQPDFLNIVVKISTTLSPDELLSTLVSIENQLQRVRNIRYGPRTIDIDIILYGELILNQAHLAIPHPRMYERGFVLIPLSEVNKGVRIPGTAKSLDDLIQKLSDKSVKKLGKIDCNRLR